MLRKPTLTNKHQRLGARGVGWNKSRRPLKSGPRKRPLGEPRAAEILCFEPGSWRSCRQARLRTGRRSPLLGQEGPSSHIRFSQTGSIDPI